MSAVLAVMVNGVLRADDALWNISAGINFDWNVATNWLPNTTFPNGAGQAAALTNDFLSTQTIRLRQSITVGSLFLGDGIASNLFNTTIANNGNETFTLTFDSGAAGVPARVALSQTGTASSYLSVPMALASDLLLDLTGTDTTNRQNLILKGTMAMNGHRVIVTNGVYTQGQLTFDSASEFTGEGEIINNSRSTLGIDGKKAFSGRLVANGKATGSNTSTFNFTNGGFTNAIEIVVNGCVSNSNTREGGGLNSGNGSYAESNPGQRFTRHRITMNAGYLVANGQPAKVGTASDWQRGLEWVRDEVAVLDIKSGFNYIAVNRGTNTAGTAFDVWTLLRSRGASVYLFNRPATERMFRAGNASAYLVGAGGAAGSPSMSIVPWMGVYDGGGFVSPFGFATYEATTGFRALDETTEYTNSITAGARYNVSVSAVTLTADATVNALRFTGGSSNIGAGKTLTVASGGIFFNGSGTLGASGSAAAGTIGFGAAEGALSVHAVNASVIGARLIGSGGLSKIQSGTLTFTGANAYSGDTHVGGGMLRVGDGTSGSTLGSGNVEVHAGATLRISCANAVIDTATMSLHNTGPDFYFGRVLLDEGIDETVKFLYLGVKPMPAGTYGSSASAAENRSDVHFLGSGVLTVTGDATLILRGTLIRVQ